MSGAGGTITTERVKQLSVNNTGVTPAWVQHPLSQTGAPTIPTAGVAIPADTVNAKVVVKVREDPAVFTSLVTVTDAQDSGTYTVTINGMDFVYTAVTDDGAAEILAGLKGVIDAGNLLSTGNVAFNDLNPDTIVRASGSFITDNVNQGTGVQKCQLVVAGAADAGNNGTFTVAGTPVALTATLVATDALTTAGAAGGITVTAFQQVTTAVETRSGTPTLVIKNSTGVETDEHTTTVGASVGALATTADATTTDYRLWGYETSGEPGAETSSDVVPGWSKINDGEETGLDYRGLEERYDIAGSRQLYCELTNDDGNVTVYIGPGC